LTISKKSVLYIVQIWGDSMEKYKECLFQEFLDTQKITITKKNKDRLFDIWLEEKARILNLYEQFLETIDLMPRRGMVELGKSNYDSVLPHTPMDTLGIAVSDEYQNIEKDKRKIVGVNGQVIVEKNNVILNYNKKQRVLDFINFYITQFPTNQETIDLLIDIMLTGKHIFIGTYGRLDDKDYENKLRKLYNLEKEIEAYTGKDIYGEVVKTSEYYLAAITPKIKYKQKNEKR